MSVRMAMDELGLEDSDLELYPLAYFRKITHDDEVAAARYAEHTKMVKENVKNIQKVRQKYINVKQAANPVRFVSTGPQQSNEKKMLKGVLLEQLRTYQIVTKAQNQLNKEEQVSPQQRAVTSIRTRSMPSKLPDLEYDDSKIREANTRRSVILNSAKRRYEEQSMESDNRQKRMGENSNALENTKKASTLAKLERIHQFNKNREIILENIRKQFAEKNSAPQRAATTVQSAPRKDNSEAVLKRVKNERNRSIKAEKERLERQVHTAEMKIRKQDMDRIAYGEFLDSRDASIAKKMEDESKERRKYLATRQMDRETKTRSIQQKSRISSFEKTADLTKKAYSRSLVSRRPPSTIDQITINDKRNAIVEEMRRASPDTLSRRLKQIQTIIGLDEEEMRSLVEESLL